MTERTDQEAKQEARKRFREMAEQEFAGVEKHIQGLSSREEAFSESAVARSIEASLKEIRDFCEHSDMGAAKILEISERLARLVVHLEPRLVVAPEDYVRKDHRGWLIPVLEKGNMAFLKLAAKLPVL